MEVLKFCDLHITKTHDLRGGCNFSLLGNYKEIISRRTALLSVNDIDKKCTLYRIAAAFKCRKGLTSAQKSDPAQHLEFVNLIRVEDIGRSIQFPESLSQIRVFERVNKKATDILSFRIRVF